MKRQLTIKLDALRQDKHTLTPEGYLICDATVTRTGVFDYVDDDGELVRELRPPEEVFADASLATLKLQPVTFLHPSAGTVTAENIRDHQVGVTGENITHDSEVVTCRVKITDKSVVRYALQRKKDGRDVELSCGYEAEVLTIPGEHPNEGHYDAVQKNIRYNHLSIVPKGRAGEKVKLKLDAKEKTAMIKFIRKALKMDGFSMDAIEADVPPEAQSVLERMSAKLDEAVDAIRDRACKIKELIKKADAEQARIDTLEAETAKLKADNTALSDPAGEKIQSIITDRLALENRAAALAIKTDGMTNREIKIAVIQKSSPGFKADDRSREYINARFDSVVELIDASTEDGFKHSLAAVIADAKNPGTQTNTDHRAEFMKKSRAMAD